MRVLVCGGRDYNDLATVRGVLDDLHNKHGIDLLIEGGAPGADFLGREWARWKFIAVQTFEADWKRHGRAAGPIRNNQMLVEGKPDLVVAFPGGRGTANMAAQARNAGVKVIEVV